MTRISTLALALFLLSGCVQKMGYQSRPEPRIPPAGTVARTTLLQEAPQPPTTLALLRRGQQRFNIYCSPCHGYSGNGDGMIVQRGFLPPPSYHSGAVRAMTDQHYYDVISHGKGAMYSYADRVSEQDRWAIIAYIRALQLSQAASLSSLSENEKGKLGP